MPWEQNIEDLQAGEEIGERKDDDKEDDGDDEDVRCSTWCIQLVCSAIENLGLGYSILQYFVYSDVEW
jgi:hypothetical protein